MPGLKSIPRTEFGDGFSLAPGDLHANLLHALSREAQPFAPTTIPTTGGAEATFKAKAAGTLAGVSVGGKDALAANNTNYLTWTVTNKGSTGTGTTAMLATSPSGVNTTKSTGGTALTVYHPNALTLATTGLTIARDDVITVTATVSGTLANTVSQAWAELEITPS